VDANGGRHGARCQELEIIDHRGMLDIEFRGVAFDVKRIVWNLNDPEKTGGLNSAVEVV
jgi:hypothetical protein